MNVSYRLMYDGRLRTCLYLAPGGSPMNPFHSRSLVLARCSAQRRNCKALWEKIEQSVDRNQPLKSKKSGLLCGNARRAPNVNLLSR